MSSSRLSNARPFQFLDHELAEAFIDTRLDREHPVRFGGERLAFYRILFGHQDRLRVLVRDVGGPEAVMVGEGMSDEIEAEILQVPEEALRVADAGDRMEPPAVKMVGAGAMIPVQEIPELAPVERH